MRLAGAAGRVRGGPSALDVLETTGDTFTRSVYTFTSTYTPRDGVILRLDGVGQGAQVEINFERAGRKTLMLAYANLEPI